MDTNLNLLSEAKNLNQTLIQWTMGKYSTKG